MHSSGLSCLFRRLNSNSKSPPSDDDEFNSAREVPTFDVEETTRNSNVHLDDDRSRSDFTHEDERISEGNIYHSKYLSLTVLSNSPSEEQYISEYHILSNTTRFVRYCELHRTHLINFVQRFCQSYECVEWVQERASGTYVFTNVSCGSRWSYRLRLGRDIGVYAIGNLY